MKKVVFIEKRFNYKLVKLILVSAIYSLYVLLFFVLYEHLLFSKVHIYLNSLLVPLFKKPSFIFLRIFCDFFFRCKIVEQPILSYVLPYFLLKVWPSSFSLAGKEQIQFFIFSKPR